MLHKAPSFSFQGSYRQVCVEFKDFLRTSQDFPSVFKDSFQGSYRQVCVEFKDFLRTSQDFPSVFKDRKTMKNTDLHFKILFLKC